jgi:hypothetical protein
MLYYSKMTSQFEYFSRIPYKAKFDLVSNVRLNTHEYFVINPPLYIGYFSLPNMRPECYKESISHKEFISTSNLFCLSVME